MLIQENLSDYYPPFYRVEVEWEMDSPGTYLGVMNTVDMLRKNGLEVYVSSSVIEKDGDNVLVLQVEAETNERGEKLDAQRRVLEQFLDRLNNIQLWFGA